MFLENHKFKRNIKITIKVLLIGILIIFMSCAIYISDFYRADMESIETFTTSEDVVMKIENDNTLIFSPPQEIESATGLIFYPGGKVEYKAYIPLMKALAAEGVHCILVEMPFNLAVFDVDAADGFQEQYPQIENWYIAGHSLGGSMTASYVSKHIDEFDGLILLGSYSTENISQASLDVISIYGSEDKVINHEKYEACKVNLPSDFEEVIIEGGCHAYFGMYGAQEDDGTPKIKNEEQIKQTVDIIIDWINKK